MSTDDETKKEYQKWFERIGYEYQMTPWADSIKYGFVEGYRIGRKVNL